MTEAVTTSSNFAAVVVAAGQGLRAAQPLPKQFALWRGKPVVRHSVEALLRQGADVVVVAIPPGCDQLVTDILSGLHPVRLVTGGATRQESVRTALDALSDDNPGLVLIHDAARPVIPDGVVARLLAALRTHAGAIPVLPVADSLAHAAGPVMGAPADRDQLRRVQTPQAFRYPEILAAHRSWAGMSSAGDDAQVAQAAGISVAMVEGDEALHKLTYSSDFAERLPIRVGTGYDVHRFADDAELWLAGVRLNHPQGLSGHSDADVAIHALVDAILGALGNGDIGHHFPPSDPQWRGASSDRFLSYAVKLSRDAGYRIGNIDLTIICESPKIGPHREAMRARLGTLLEIEIGAVSVKATTTEGLGFSGRREGIAAQAIVTLLAT